MSKTDDIGNNLVNNLGIANKRAADKPNNEMGQDEFFKLMVAQLQNQDPLKPLESNEFIGQMAQFSVVNGVQEMQQTFAGLANSLQSSQALQASTLVGRSVLIPGFEGELASEGNMRGAVELPQSTPGLSVAITDASGQPVRQLDLGPREQGLVNFQWDGFNERGERAPPGEYRINAAYPSSDGPLAAETLVVAHVDSVTLGGVGQDPQLNVTGKDPVPLGVVREIM